MVWLKLWTTILSNLFVCTFAAGDRFDPLAYKPRIANCVTNQGSQVEQQLRLEYFEINRPAQPAIIAVHGWPGLWSTWSNQIKELERDYHLILPNIRGFGASQHPGGVEGTMMDFVSDLICVLKTAGVTHATCLGHDWGSQICYEAGRMRPDIFTSIIALGIPYIPSSGGFTPIKNIAAFLPKFNHQVYFDSQTEKAVIELNRNISRTIRASMRTIDSPPPEDFLESASSYLHAWNNIHEIPAIPFLSSEEEAYLVGQYTIQGFHHTLQLYSNKNRFSTWEFAHAQGNHTIPQPVLSLLPLNDPVGNMVFAAAILGSASHLPKLTTKTMTGAHWFHMENHAEANQIIRDWLNENVIKAGGTSNLVHEEL